jgi:glycosyltransferase involved in cell wall biosynthesis
VLERLAANASRTAAVEPVESSWDNGKPAGTVLTIYIPTKNRPELAALLDSLAPQLDERVEVVVSDNAGTASNLVRDLLGDSCRVEYSRRAYDIGGDANILRGFTAGTAPWLWILGDDDTVTDTAIQTVLSHIGWTTSDRLILMSNSSPRGACGAIGSLAQIAERDPALPIAATLISANVVRRSACDVAAGFSRVDTKYGHAYAFPGLVHVVPDPVLEHVGRLHAGEGVPDGWDGQAVKADYLRSVGIEPSAENFRWNYMEA